MDQTFANLVTTPNPERMKALKQTPLKEGAIIDMDISTSISALIGGISGAAISGLISAYNSHKSLKQAARDKLISSAYDAAIAEFSASVSIFNAHPDVGVIPAFADYLVYHIAFIQGISSGDKSIELDDRTVLAALDRAKNLSLLRKSGKAASRVNF
jgi:hypothetical protein